MTLRTIFTRFDPELYIPLTFLSYQLDYALWGLDPFGYHLTSLLLHILNTVLVFWFVLSLTSKTNKDAQSDYFPFFLPGRQAGIFRFSAPRSRDVSITTEHWVAAVTAFLFLLHPLHTEAVAWASARKDVLATTFALGFLIAYHRYLTTQKNILPRQSLPSPRRSPYKSVSRGTPLRSCAA